MSPDPTSEATFATAAGLAAAVVATIGVHPQTVMYSMVGAVIGVTFAAPASRWRAISVFTASTLACALAGEWMAIQYMGGKQLTRDLCACALAIVFHPLLASIVQRLPALADTVLGRLGGKT